METYLLYRSAELTKAGTEPSPAMFMRSVRLDLDTTQGETLVLTLRGNAYMRSATATGEEFRPDVTHQPSVAAAKTLKRKND